MIAHLVKATIEFFAPWQSLYSDSKTVAGIVTAVHLLALLFGGGLAVAADRATLRATSSEGDERRRVLLEIRSIHRPVLIALIALFASGFALATADLQTFLGSQVFWIKLGLVALLLLNGVLLERTETRLRDAAADARPQSIRSNDRLWKRLRLAAVMSLLLWSSTLIAGTVLVNA